MSTLTLCAPDDILFRGWHYASSDQLGQDVFARVLMRVCRFEAVKLSSNFYSQPQKAHLLFPTRSIAAPPRATQSQDHSALVAMETENLRQEYEAKLADEKSSYEAELMSKQNIH